MCTQYYAISGCYLCQKIHSHDSWKVLELYSLITAVIIDSIAPILWSQLLCYGHFTKQINNIIIGVCKEGLA